MTKVRPRSLLQLVLMGFVLVLMPLGSMNWHSSKNLTHLGQIACDEMAEAVNNTRRVTLLNAQAIDIERTLRHFTAQGDRSILASYWQQIDRYRELLMEHRRAIPDNDIYDNLEKSLLWLDSLHDVALINTALTSDKLHLFNQLNQRLESVTHSQVDEKIREMHLAIAGLTQKLWWVSVLVVGLSLVVALIFTYLIIRPVRQIESRILSLGAGVEPDPKPVDGPAELVVLGDRLLWLHNKLKELELQKYQFMRHVSHELKTPLAVLREGSDLLCEQQVGLLNVEQLDICQMLDESSRRLQTLIERLLDFNRLTQQEMFEIESVQLAPMFNKLMAEYRLALESKRMHVHLPTAPMSMLAEPYRLWLILDNLFSNAVSYGASGGNIWIRTGQDELTSWLEVANDGPKIPEAEQRSIYEPFVQGNRVRQGVLKGSGIGLSIALESANSLGGELTLKKDQQADVCFRLTLKSR